jgi:hypothetical protein
VVAVDWWQALLNGLISAIVGGLVTVGVAWWVFTATRDHERRQVDEQEARRAGAAIMRAAGPYLSALGHAARLRSTIDAAAARVSYHTEVTANLPAILKVDEAFGTQIIEKLGAHVDRMDAIRVRRTRWLPSVQQIDELARELGTMNGEIGFWMRKRQ